MENTLQDFNEENQFKLPLRGTKVTISEIMKCTSFLIYISLLLPAGLPNEPFILKTKSNVYDLSKMMNTSIKNYNIEH